VSSLAQICRNPGPSTHKRSATQRSRHLVAAIRLRNRLTVLIEMFLLKRNTVARNTSMFLEGVFLEIRNTVARNTCVFLGGVFL
jgi:hypothetical protein